MTFTAINSGTKTQEKNNLFWFQRNVFVQDATAKLNGLSYGVALDKSVPVPEVFLAEIFARMNQILKATPTKKSLDLKLSYLKASSL